MAITMRGIFQALRIFFYYFSMIFFPNVFQIFSFFPQAEDLLEDILSFESSSLGDSLKLDASLSGDLQIKQEPLILSDAEMHAMAKDRQKKDNHNMSE